MTIDASSFFVLLLAVAYVHGQGIRSDYLHTCGHQREFDSRHQGQPIVSRHHPDDYPNDHECLFRIHAPPGHSVFVVFEVFNLENQETCSYDSLSVFDGNGTTTGSRIARHCGTRLPNPIKSRSSSLTLLFKTDSSVRYSGYKLRFFFCSNRDCCNVLLINGTGSISSPNYPRYYPGNQNCQYHLLAHKPWKRIYLRFTTLRFEIHERCEYDYVTIRNGFRPDSCVSPAYCSGIPPPFVSSTNAITVTFQSDAATANRGFRAEYTPVLESAPQVRLVNACAIANGCCQERCRSVNGHAHCSCAPGKILQSDGRTCRYPSYCELPYWQRRILFAPQTRVVPGRHYSINMGPRQRVGVVRRVRPTFAYVCWIDGGCGDYRLCGNGKWDISLENPAISMRSLGSLTEPACGRNNGGCDHDCQMVNGRPQCTCFDGYMISPSNRSQCIIDGCTDNNGGCADRCSPLSAGRVLCTCRPGWTLRPDGGCVDVDECTTKNGGCEQRCVNSPGSFRCECDFRYFRLAENGRNCSDIDECVDPDTHHCQQQCVNTQGSFYCDCREGWTLSSNGRTCNDFDECYRGAGMRCQQKCVNTPGSFHCACHLGYRVNPEHNMTCLDVEECTDYADMIRDQANCLECHEKSPLYECTRCKPGYEVSFNKTWCNDINECQTNNGNCPQICTNSPGSFDCSCRPGYTKMELFDNGTMVSLCVNINECTTNNGGCSHTCTDLPGNYSCSCPRGMRLGEDKHTCEDVNECRVGNGNCAQNCNNTVGGHFCSCRNGYLLAEDGRSCVDVNECSTNNGGCNGTSSSCTNTEGSYSCGCGQGYELAGNQHTCMDINECSPSLNSCDHRCTNTPGSYICSCDSGYRLNITDEHTCHDINECLEEPCNGTCHNTAGSYMCRCPDGFRVGDDNHSCDDIDECAEGIARCQQRCRNFPGGFQCKCNRGYRLYRDGFSCNDINECRRPDRNCCTQTCNNTDGSFRCGCRDGFYLDTDGCTCRDVLECSVQNGGCEQDCIEETGSYRCQCRPGFIQDEFNKTQCHDINECSVNNGGCQQSCQNTDGGHQCSCASTFQLQLDQRSCSPCPTCQSFTELQSLVRMLVVEVQDLRSQLAALQGVQPTNPPPGMETSIPATTEELFFTEQPTEQETTIQRTNQRQTTEQLITEQQRTEQETTEQQTTPPPITSQRPPVVQPNEDLGSAPDEEGFFLKYIEDSSSPDLGRR